MKNALQPEVNSGNRISRTDQPAVCQANGEPPSPAVCLPFAGHRRCPSLAAGRKAATVVLVENRTLVRQGIHSLLTREDKIRVVGQALDEKGAMELVEKLRPDVVILCATLAFLNGMQITRQILRLTSSPRVIILGRHEDEAYVNHAADLGVAGYVTEQFSGKALAHAVRMARRHALPFGTASFRSPPDRLKKSDPACRRLPGSQGRLTCRQTQILQLVAQGNANKQIASLLSISIKTVEKHRANLMAKLGIHETAGLTRYAIAADVVKCDGNRGTQSGVESVPPLAAQSLLLPLPGTAGRNLDFGGAVKQWSVRD